MKKKKQKVKTKGREIEKKILTVHGSYNIYSVFKKKTKLTQRMREVKSCEKGIVYFQLKHNTAQQKKSFLLYT
jgi:hypothetical protein